MIAWPSIRRVRFVVASLLAVAACKPDATAPTGARPPYLAIIVSVDAPAEVTSRGPYSFRVRELSGTLPVDTTVRASPKDTIIFHVEPASYRVDIADVPATCGVRDGNVQAITVPPNTNTSLVRFFVICTPALTVSVFTDGAIPDSAYVLTVRSSTGAERVSVLPSNGSARLDGLAAGTYAVSLRHIDTHCMVTSDGGENVSASITASGGAAVAFRVVCAEVNRRPRIVQLAASHGGGSVGFLIRATDLDGDIERSFLDITDCNRKSVLPVRGRLRGGFSGFPNVTRKDTAVIVGAYDLGLTDAQLAGRCIAVWVADARGNHSEWVEVPLVARTSAKSPVATTFNARYNGTRGLQVALSTTDPDGDFVGLFFTYLLRDGVVLLPADGQPDRLVSDPPGIIGSTILELPFGIGFGAWNDYLGVIVYLVDKAGNFTRLEDSDLFR